MRSRASTFALGLAGGAAATAPMTAVMLAAQRLGKMGRLPPSKITEAALDRLGADVPPDAPVHRALTALNHLGFGAACGVVFAAIHGARGTAAQTIASGAAFGTAVWWVSYLGWVPALGILPHALEDRRDRPVAMLLAHWVFGATLGAIVHRWARGWRRAACTDPGER